MKIYIKRKDFNGSPLMVNGVVLRLTTHAEIDVPDSFLEVMSQAGIPYTPVLTNPGKTGRVLIPLGTNTRIGVTVNGVTTYYPVGSPLTLDATTKAIMIEAGVPVLDEVTEGGVITDGGSTGGTGTGGTGTGGTGTGGGGTVTPSTGNLLLHMVGQSNSRSAGVAGAGDIPSEWTALSADDKARVKVWDHQNAQWLNYQPAVNAEILATSLWGGSGGKWGPECLFAVNWLAANPGKTLYIIKLGINGTGLDGAITQPRWAPADGTLYAAMSTYSAAARANLAAAGVTYSQARLMMQGEADAMPPAGSPTGTAYGPATRYQANITAFEASSRADWCGGAASVPLIIGRIQALDYPNTAGITDATNNRVDQAYVVRAGQVAAADASSGSIRVVDLDTGLGGAPVLHPGTAWVKDMGQRMWAAYYGTYTATYGDIHDTTPAAITIPDKNGQAASATVLSDVVTITGLTMKAAISVSAGLEYRILLAENTMLAGVSQTVYQDWGSAAGTIENNQRVQLRRTSSATAGATLTGTLTVGGVAATWKVQTTTATAKPGNTRSNALEAKMTAIGASAFSTDQHNAVVDFFAAIGAYLDSGKIKALAIPAIHDEMAARIRWDDQSTVATKTGAPAWTAAIGYNPNGASNTFVDYGYNSSLPSQDGLGVGVYIKTLSASTGTDIQLNIAPAGVRLIDGGSGSVTARASLNGGNAAKTWTFAPGLVAAQRVSNAAVRFYNGGNPIAGDVASASAASANTMLRIGGGTTANRPIGALVVTDGFVDADWSAFNSALVTLLTAFGAN